MTNYKIQILLISIVTALLVSVSSASAHGGVQKQAGDITVYLTQMPLSPIIGEDVKMTFVFSKGLNKQVKDLDVELTLIDTFFNDATRDTVILTEKKRTDVNGAFDFVYTFDKENYFDVDLKFVDPETKEEGDIGFLVQPRYRASLGMIILVNVLILAVVSAVVWRMIIKSKSERKT
jgi:hypothetical protein